ncbi:ZirU family protein [Hafnia paralvei]|uniref:ZirU family protein n=1 Tax=Hafnia paralvei TaxID=546367 RepID=UPI001CB9AACE|nr:ZirU family protein [Hafnia paralvei]
MNIFKKTLLAATVSATFFSMQANAELKANSATSEPTLASVGYRPVQTDKGGKKLTVKGNLTTGAQLEITNIAYTDSDGDQLSLDKMVQSEEGIKWYLVDNNDSATSGDPAGVGKTFIIPADAAGKKVKVIYRIQTDTGVPSNAFLPTAVLLTKASSGVDGEGSADGSITNKLKLVNIEVKYPSGVSGPTNELNGNDIQGTPIVGSTLVATLTCADDAADVCDVKNYNFKWQMAENKSSEYIDITPTGDIAHQYQIQGTQQNKLFRVLVTPNNSLKSDASAQKNKRAKPL